MIEKKNLNKNIGMKTPLNVIPSLSKNSKVSIYDRQKFLNLYGMPKDEKKT